MIRRILTATTVVAVMAIGVAASSGAFTTSDTTIRACYGKVTGLVRVLDANAKGCLKFENPISWAQQGVQGEPGAAGAAGSARAFATVWDFGTPDPVLAPAPRTLEVDSVVRVSTGAYCVFVDASLGDVTRLTPVVTPEGGTAEPRYATTSFCAEDANGRRAIQVALFDAAGEHVNGGFHLIVP